jgi:spore coat polysaccharide biosynthesis protein SpsF
MNVVAIVQARMGSSRLPGKVLRELGGKPMLAQQLARLLKARTLNNVVVATTEDPRDEPIAQLCASLGIQCIRAHELDVLSRYHEAARVTNADVVVRITADCPLIDPGVTDQVVSALLERPQIDYTSNVVVRTFPRGLDVEAFWRDTLERMHRMAHSRHAREHVTTFLREERPTLFATHPVLDQGGNASDLRWTVDTPEDLTMIKAIFWELDLANHYRTYPEILAFIRARPWLSAINAHIKQRVA